MQTTYPSVSPRLSQAASLALLAAATLVSPLPLLAENAPPRIVQTTPTVGATNVDPAVQEITVTFDQDMASGFSWTGGGPDRPPGREGARPQWRDKRTCVLPVALERGRYYRVGINSKSHRNFRSAAGVPTLPTAIYFVTQGADEAALAKVRKPTVLRMEPANGSQAVDPSLSEIRVTFSAPMGGGFSWCGGGENYPEIPAGTRPQWNDDHTVCTLPVKLKPDWTYRLSLNAPSAVNFQSAHGVPLEPYPVTFTTGK